MTCKNEVSIFHTSESLHSQCFSERNASKSDSRSFEFPYADDLTEQWNSILPLLCYWVTESMSTCRLISTPQKIKVSMINNRLQWCPDNSLDSINIFLKCWSSQNINSILCSGCRLYSHYRSWHDKFISLMRSFLTEKSAAVSTCKLQHTHSDLVWKKWQVCQLKQAPAYLSYQ